MKKSDRDPATINLHMIKNRQEADNCPTRNHCVQLWGGEEVFSSIRDLTKFELIYEQDAFLYKTGDRVSSIYVIQSGAIKLEKEIEDNDNHISGFYFTGDLVGLESLGLEQHKYHAIALKETWVCEIRLNKIARLGKSAEPILQKINTQLSQNLREVDEHLYSTRNLYTEQRLLCFLNSICKKNLEPVEDNPDLFLLPMTKGDIANYLGMRAESLSRAFRELENLEIVKNLRNNRKVSAVDKQKLFKLFGMFGKRKSGTSDNCI